MIGLGLVATVGQYLLYERFGYTPASALAPVEYTGLIWAFVYGCAIWTEIPTINVFIGAMFIVAASLALVRYFHRGSFCGIMCTLHYEMSMVMIVRVGDAALSTMKLPKDVRPSAVKRMGQIVERNQ